MANYARTYTQAQLLQPLESIEDAKFRKVMERILNLIGAELDDAVTDQDGFTVSTTLVADILLHLLNLPDLTRKLIIEIWANRIAAELALAGDGTLFNYTVTTGLAASMWNDILNLANVETRISFDLINGMLFDEFTAMALAS